MMRNVFMWACPHLVVVVLAVSCVLDAMTKQTIVDVVPSCDSSLPRKTSTEDNSRRASVERTGKGDAPQQEDEEDLRNPRLRYEGVEGEPGRAVPARVKHARALARAKLEALRQQWEMEQRGAQVVASL